jgi:FKBP-type peptidyl-prolyl cis-trans isomerase
MRAITILSLSLGLLACGGSKDDHAPAPTGSQTPAAGSAAAPKPSVAQVAPPIPVQTPPADATKTESGLIYKKLVANAAGEAPKRNDIVVIKYTGWRQATGETFFSTAARGPARMNLAQAAPGFTEAMQLVHKGETIMLWMPPAIGYKSQPPKPETLVYQIELTAITPAPAIPEDVGNPPAKAIVLPLGTKYVSLRPGTGKTKARQFDNVTYTYTVWNSDGKMLDNTMGRERPTVVAPWKESPALNEILTHMTVGERARFWVDAEKAAATGRAIPGAKGVLCYEVEVSQIEKAVHEAALTPADVAKPPADARKSPKGVFYKVLKAAPAKNTKHPLPTETVKVAYTGWTTDGRMFDSSEIRGEPAVFSLTGVVPGWTDAIPLMSVGDRWRLWIPEPLAYKGKPGKPKGMLVFEVELFEIISNASH